MVSFYKSRLPGVTSVHELNALLRSPGAADALFMKESDLMRGQSGREAGQFPDSVLIGAAEFPVVYEFDPSSELDGPSIRIPLRELAVVNNTVFDWIVPGLYEPRIRFLLQSLPKSESGWWKTQRKLHGELRHPLARTAAIFSTASAKAPQF